MSIQALIDQGLTEEQAIKLAVDELGMTEDYARFVLAMERGEIKSDVIEEKPPKDKGRKKA